MTLPRYAAICEHWGRVPPLSVSAWVIAQWTGAKLDKKAATAKASPEQKSQDRQALMDLMAGAGGIVTGRPEWLRELMK